MRPPPTAAWLPCLALLLAPRVNAQPAGAPEPVVQADPVVITAAPAAIRATEATRVTVPDVMPAAERSLAEIADTIANLRVSSSGAGSFGSLLALRGLANTPYFSAPSVAVYFDDLPLGSSFTYPVDLFGFGSVTVQRGPQPTAAGRNGEGGLIVFSSPRPGATAAGSVRAGFGNYDRRQGAIEYRTARGERADATVAASASARRGYVENTELGQSVDDQQATTGSARVRIRPAAGTEITVQVLANAHRDGAQPLVPLAGPAFTVARGREGVTDSTLAGAAVTMSVATGAGTLSATTSRTRWRLDPYTNRLVLPPTLDSQLTQSQSAWNEELRFTSAAATIVPWHLGAWLSAARTHGAVNRAIPGLYPIEVSSYGLDARSAAAFGDATIALRPGLHATAAVRLEDVRQQFERHERVPANGSFALGQRSAVALPKLTLAADLGADTHATASVSRGWKPGGMSAFTDQPALAAFRPETVTAYEMGAAGRWPTAGLQLASRLFNYEIRDAQLERSFTATDYLVANAPRARSTGGEVELTWTPRPEWTVAASVGVTRAILLDFTDPFTRRTYRGSRTPAVPAHDGRVSIGYHARHGWWVTAGASWTGRVFFDESESPTFAAPAHLLTRAALGWDGGRWRVVLYGDNLGDVRSTTLIIPGVRHRVPGAPQTWGVEVAAGW